MDLLWPAVVVAGLGLVFGLALAFASKKFHVQKDERFEPVRAALPGANCGACGFAGCDSLADAIIKGEAPINKCPVGGAKAAAKIAGIMGVDAGGSEVRKVAFVRCQGTLGGVKSRYEYEGITDCRAASDVSGGPLACRFGCLGMGTCEKACPFGAIKVEGGIATVDKAKCVGCGVCVASCPRHVIELYPEDTPVVVACRNTDAGKIVRTVCMRGCIACRMCERKCEQGAIKVTDGVSHVDYTKCIGCAKCADNCPTKVIQSFVRNEEIKPAV